MMCVTEQYVIFGLSQCQGQEDIWHLLLEHVVMMVSISACENVCAQKPVADCGCNINNKEGAVFPLIEHLIEDILNIMHNQCFSLPPIRQQFSPPLLLPCPQMLVWEVLMQDEGFRTLSSSVLCEASGFQPLQSQSSTNIKNVNDSEAKTKVCNVNISLTSTQCFNLTKIFFWSTLTPLYKAAYSSIQPSLNAVNIITCL